MKRKIQQTYHRAHHGTRKVYKRITATLIRFPVRSFFGVLGVLFLFIIIGNFLDKPKVNKSEAQPIVKTVSVYSIGMAPRIQVTAQVEKSGVVKIIAQSSGIVQKIYPTVGAHVGKGDWLMWLSTNYQGGTLSTVTRQIAQKNYDFVTANYDSQKDIIGKQRKMADDAQTQASDMRDITNNSISDTQNLINQDQDIVNSLSDQITYLESINSGGDQNAAIIQAKQGQAGAQAGINSLRVALAQAQYQVNTDKAPTQLVNLQHDLTIQQLTLQEKSLDLNKDLAQLNLRVAQITESLMYPVSPVTGTVERVNVQVGENVNPGTLLATITGDTTVSTIVALVPSDVAKNISRLEQSKIIVGDKAISEFPQYVSSEATDGSLNSVIFSVPPEDEALFTDGANVIVELPIGGVQSTSVVPYVPLDAVYQTQTDSYVYVASPSAKNTYTAHSKHVTLGQVYGEYVEVTSGLTGDDQIVTDRNVLDGDMLKLQE